MGDNTAFYATPPCSAGRIEYYAANVGTSTPLFPVLVSCLPSPPGQSQQCQPNPPRPHQKHPSTSSVAGPAPLSSPPPSSNQQPTPSSPTPPSPPPPSGTAPTRATNPSAKTSPPGSPPSSALPTPSPRTGYASPAARARTWDVC